MAINGDDTDISVLNDEEPSVNVGLQLDQHQEEFQLYRGRPSCEKKDSLESYHALNYAYTDLKHRYNDLLHKYTTSQRRSSVSAGSTISPRQSTTTSPRSSMGDEFIQRGPRDHHNPWLTTNLSPRTGDTHLRRHSPLGHAVDMDAAGSVEEDSPYVRPSRTGVGHTTTSTRPHSTPGGSTDLDFVPYLNQHGMDMDQVRTISHEQSSLRRENKSLQEKLSGHEQVNQHLTKMNSEMKAEKSELEKKVKLLEDALRDQRPRSSNSNRDLSPVARMSPRPRTSSLLDDDETVNTDELQHVVSLLMKSQEELHRLKEHVWKQNEVIRMMLGRYGSTGSGSVDSNWLNDTVQAANTGEMVDGVARGTEGQGARPKVRQMGGGVDYSHTSSSLEMNGSRLTAMTGSRLTASTSTDRLLKPQPKPRTMWSSDPGLNQGVTPREHARSHHTEHYTNITEELEHEDTEQKMLLVSPSSRDRTIRPGLAEKTPSIENSLAAHGLSDGERRTDETSQPFYNYPITNTMLSHGIRESEEQTRASELSEGLQRQRQLDRQPDAGRRFDLDLRPSHSKEVGRAFDLDFRRSNADGAFELSPDSCPDISPEIDRALEPTTQPKRDTYSERMRHLDLESVGDMDIGQGQGPIVIADSDSGSGSPESFQPSTLVMEESSSPAMEERNNAAVNQDDRVRTQPRPINIDRNEYELGDHRDNDNTRQNINLSTTLTSDKYRNPSGEDYAALNNDILVTHKTIPRRNLYHDTNEPSERSTSVSTNNTENAQVIRICPVCNEEFPSSMPMDDFQEHVLECVILPDETSSPTLGACSRVCPMCNEIFPSTVTQAVFENHVHEHFGEGPISAADPFEFVPSDTGI